MGSLFNYKNLITFAKAPKSPNAILSPYKDLIKSLKDDGQWKSSFLLPLKDEPYNISNILSQIVQQEVMELKKYISDFSIYNLNNDIYKFKEFYDLSEEDSTIHCILEVLSKLPKEAYSEHIYAIIYRYYVDAGFGHFAPQEWVLGYVNSKEQAMKGVALYSSNPNLCNDDEVFNILPSKGEFIYRAIYPL